MTTTLNDLPAPAQPPQSPRPQALPPTARDQQRGALRDLVALATESAATEAQIEHRLATMLEAANLEGEKSKWAVQAKYKGLEEEARTKQAETLAGIETSFTAQTKAIESDAAEARRIIHAESEPRERKVKEKLNHDVWLADSVLDVAQNQVREEGKKAREVYDQRGEEVETMRARAWSLMKDYGVPPPPSADDQPEAPVAPEDASAAAEDGVESGEAVAAVTAADVNAELSQKNEPAPPAAGSYPTRQEAARLELARLGGLALPRLFVGALPYIVLGLVVVLAGVGAQLYRGLDAIDFQSIGIAAGGALVVCLGLGFLLSRAARNQVLATYAPFDRELTAARRAAKAELAAAEQAGRQKFAHAQRRRDQEVRTAKERVAPVAAKHKARREELEKSVKEKRQSELARVTADRDRARKEAERSHEKNLRDIQGRLEVDLKAAHARHEATLRDARRQHHQARSALERRLQEGLNTIQVPAPSAANAGSDDAKASAGADLTGLDGRAPLDWNDPAWEKWTPPMTFATAVRFGELRIDLPHIAAAAVQETARAARAVARPPSLDQEADAQAAEAAVAPEAAPRLALPEAFSVPATLAFPQGASLLIQSDREGRDDALRILQTVMARLLVSLPAGRARFTILDPVGLGQNFAGFMHLADYDDNLVGGRIWTETEQIEKRLTDLTEHMETVIQKYLRNEFATIDEYNAQAGELAEPYRFLVVADFPASFGPDALRRLSSICASGPRCGVYTLIVRDTRIPSPGGTHFDDIEIASVNLVRKTGTFFWQDEIFRQFPLVIDPAPTEDRLTRITHVVGQGAKEANRVEVPFDSIAPRLEQFWTRSSAEEMQVPVGRMGATRLQQMRLGRGVAQHVLIAGKTGSGKSTLLHALVTNLAMWYSPAEVEFYLIDFKKGVEFKTYATHRLPHARAIAVESDREFGLSVLQRLDGELARRGDLYRRAGVQDLASYRQTPGALIMPRTLLMIDEFQEFFSEDDRLAQEAGLLLDRLVRQGRAFGIHVLLGSQTIGGSSGLARSTIGQMAVRVALQTSEADSQLILGDGNSAARLLSRPGEAIYNDQGGLVEANSPFQVAWLPDERREVYLDRVRQKSDAADAAGGAGNGAANFGDTVVFEGNAAADVSKNATLGNMLAAPAWPAPGAIIAPRAFLGDPVAIKDPAAVSFRRQSGSNLLIIGQQDEQSLAMMISTMISLAAQHRPSTARFYVMDGTPADSPLTGVFERARATLPHDARNVEYRAVGDVIAELSAEVTRRQSADPDAGGGAADPELYVFVYALQRYRALRKSEDDYSFSLGGGDEEKKANPGKQFAELLRDGPPAGVHVIGWIDTPIALERTLDRTTLREFDNRVLFQMSANDSSNLIDSPAANKLGLFRALSYSEEQGTVEKFRPYGLPGRGWLEEVRAGLTAKSS